MNINRGWKRPDQALLKVSGLALLCVGFFVFHIWFRTLALTTGYEVGELRHSLTSLESELTQAQVERTRLMGPESLQKLVADFARQGVLFAPPKPAQLIYTKMRR